MVIYIYEVIIFKSSTAATVWLSGEQRKCSKVNFILPHFSEKFNQNFCSPVITKIIVLHRSNKARKSNSDEGAPANYQIFPVRRYKNPIA
jgi:hypothetical protein